VAYDAQRARKSFLNSLESDRTHRDAACGLLTSQRCARSHAQPDKIIACMKSLTSLTLALGDLGLRHVGM
jgi:hypothetical protein